MPAERLPNMRTAIECRRKVQEMNCKGAEAGISERSEYFRMAGYWRKLELDAIAKESASARCWLGRVTRMGRT